MKNAVDEIPFKIYRFYYSDGIIMKSSLLFYFLRRKEKFNNQNWVSFKLAPINE